MAQPASSSADATILVVDEPTLFAESLRTALVLEGYQVHLVGPEDLVEQGHRVAPAIAVVDLDVESAGRAHRMIHLLAAGGVRVLVVTASEDQDRWAQCLELGAAAVAPKNVTLHELVSLIRRMVAGHAVMTDGERESMLRVWHDHTRVEMERQARFARLDAGERWVLGHLMKGRVPPEIARLAAVQPYVVNGQVRSIMAKLKVGSTHAAVALAHEHGWSPPPT